MPVRERATSAAAGRAIGNDAPRIGRHGALRRAGGGRSAVRAAFAGLAAASVAGSLLFATGASAGSEINVIRDPGFEKGTSDWKVLAGASLISAPGHSGSRGARVTNTSKVASTVALNDKVNSVANTVKGHGYSASAWVRLTTPGQSVVVRLMEYAGSRRLGQAQKSLWITDTGWHRIELAYPAVSDGASLDFNILTWKLPAGSSFDVDDVTLMGPASQAAEQPPAAATSSAPTPSTPVAPTPSKTTVPTPTKSSVPTSSAPAQPAPGRSSTAGTPNGVPGSWQYAWGDEFDGASVDSSKWRVRDGDYLSYDLATIVKSNVSVAGGVLSLRANREAAAHGRGYTSAYMDTIGKASWTYGRFEMRARLPLAQGSSQGLWPAFWLRPDNGGTGELDIMEAVGSTTSANKVSQTIWYDYDGTYPKQTAGYSVPGSTTAWHTYAVEWDPDAVRWYVDDVLTFTRSRSTTSWLSDAFSKPFNIRLNLQVGGSWAGSPNAATDFSQTYDVDYVRVYQRP